ncbi:MAG: hypothetical protein ABFR32_04625 [Bacteroidota bacterium]
MVKKEITVKNEFFINSLFIEDMISNYITDKFGIKNAADSAILGNSSKSLNFNQKIDFLLELGDFSIIDKSKLSVFKEVRKEFLCNKDASSLEESFTSLDHNDDFLLIMYPQETFLPREEKLTVASYNLIEDVSQLVANTTNKPEITIQKNNTMKSILGIKYSAVKLSKFAMFLSIFLFK